MKRNRDTASPFTKTAGSASKENPDSLAPIFSFEKMPDGSGYSVNCCDEENRSALLRRLFLLSSMSWAQIRNAPRKGLGTEIIARSSLNIKVPGSVPEDVNILSLRYNGNRPFLGYRAERVFYLIFIDHNFSVYDHE